jgi:hypothetical protein
MTPPSCSGSPTPPEPYGFYRVYVFSDRQCVNTVFRAPSSAPAYAAATRHAAVPETGRRRRRQQILELGDEGKTFTAEGSSRSRERSRCRV